MLLLLINSVPIYRAQWAANRNQGGDVLCSTWLLLFYATSVQLGLCVQLLIAHYTTVIMLKAR